MGSSYEYILGKRTKNIIYQILNNFSVSEIYSFVDQVVNEDFIYYSNINRNIQNYGEYIPIRMLEFAENAIVNKTVVSRHARKENIPRSALSIIFYDLILKWNDEGFTESLKAYWENKPITIYKKNKKCVFTYKFQFEHVHQKFQYLWH